MLFEAAPEDTARRVAEALLAAETGASDAWRILNEGALYRLRSDADAVVTLVPYAFMCLVKQLVMHPRSAVRLDAVRYATLAYTYTPAEAEAALRDLARDRSRGVQRAARIALGEQPEPLEELHVVSLAEI